MRKKIQPSKNKQPLTLLRRKIDNIDQKIITLLSKRFTLTQKIAHLKLKNKEPIEQTKREEQMFKNFENLAKKFNLNKNFIKKLFYLIVGQSKKNQQESVKKKFA